MTHRTPWELVHFFPGFLNLLDISLRYTVGMDLLDFYLSFLFVFVLGVTSACWQDFFFFFDKLRGRQKFDIVKVRLLYAECAFESMHLKT